MNEVIDGLAKFYSKEVIRKSIQPMILKRCWTCGAGPKGLRPYETHRTVIVRWCCHRRKNEFGKKARGRR